MQSVTSGASSPHHALGPLANSRRRSLANLHARYSTAGLPRPLGGTATQASYPGLLVSYSNYHTPSPI